MSTASEDFHYITLSSPAKPTTIAKRLRQKVVKAISLLACVVSEGKEPEGLGGVLEGVLADLEEVRGDGKGWEGYASLVVSMGICEGLVKALGVVDGGGRVVLCAR